MCIYLELGGLLPVFEKNLEGLAVGDNFTFGLTADEDYGQHDQEAIVNLDKKIFEVEGKTMKNYYKSEMLFQCKMSKAII